MISNKGLQNFSNEIISGCELIIHSFNAIITKRLLEFCAFVYKKPIINGMLVITDNKHKKLWLSTRKSLLENV